MGAGFLTLFSFIFKPPEKPVELFHLENGPHEVINLVDENVSLVEKLTESVKDFLEEPGTSLE